MAEEKRLSLNGLRILNTRPLAQSDALNAAIITAGGLAIACPALSIEPINCHVPHLTNMHYAIFTSANAVNYCFAALRQQHLTWPKLLSNIAIGRATATMLRKHGIAISSIPPEENSESLLELKIFQRPLNKTILLIKGVGGRALLAETLIARGANLHILEVYKRSMPEFNPQYIQSLWQEQAADIILFTSQQSMHNIFVMFAIGGEAAYTWLRDTPCLVISQRLAKAAAALGIKQVIVCKSQAILATLCRYKQGL